VTTIFQHHRKTDRRTDGRTTLTHCCAWPAVGRSALHVDRPSATVHASAAVSPVSRTIWLIHEVRGRPAGRLQPWCGMSPDLEFTASFSALCAGVLSDWRRMWPKRWNDDGRTVAVKTKTQKLTSSKYNQSPVLWIRKPAQGPSRVPTIDEKICGIGGFWLRASYHFWHDK